MAALAMTATEPSTALAMARRIGKEFHCPQARMGPTVWRLILARQPGFIWRHGRKPPDYMATAAAFFFPKMPAKPGGKFWIATNMFMTSPLTQGIRIGCTLLALNLRRGVRWIAVNTGPAFPDSISSGPIA